MPTPLNPNPKPTIYMEPAESGGYAITTPDVFMTRAGEGARGGPKLIFCGSLVECLEHIRGLYSAPPEARS